MHEHDQAADYRDQLTATARLALWTLAWVATLAAAKFGPEHLWDSDVASWAAVVVNLLVGVGWIIAHARYLRTIDELQRKIQQDALAVTLGMGWVGGLAYVVAHAADLVEYEADVGALSVALAAIYLIATAVGYIRYR